MPAATNQHRDPAGPAGARAGRLRLLLVAHGYPPAEQAGTEQHVAAVARGLSARGHEVAVLAATRDPARRQYSRRVEREASGVVVHRVVQNVPVRALASAERDRAIEAAAGEVAGALRPDLVHIHHLQFLSSGLRFPAPTVLTLHDQWLWCAAGGLGLRLGDRDSPRGGRPCPGASPEACAPCAAAWAPAPGRAARATLAAAGHLAGRVPPDALHGALRVLPASLRRRLQAPRRGTAAEPAEAAAERNRAMAELAAGLALRLAPSRHLAARAEAHGLGPVEVLPHGIEPLAPGPPPAGRTGPLLFLGTIAHHKGPDLVVRAWRRAFPAATPGLALHGPIQDPALALGHPLGGPLDRAGVAAALASARALVVGSVWPENAPLVVLEARAAGCPVIAPALGGLPELVEPGRDGWLYPPGDEAALAEAMRAAVAHPLAARPRPPLDLEAHLDLLLACYDRALGVA